MKTADVLEKISVAKYTGLMAAGRGGRMLLRFLVAIVITRNLGAEDYGLYTLALSVMAILMELCVFGLDNASIRFLAQFREDSDPMRTSQMVRFVLSGTAVLSLGVAIVTVFWGARYITEWMGVPELEMLLKVLLVMLITGSSLRVFFGILRGVGNLSYQIIIENLFIPGGQLILLLPVLFLGYRLWGVVSILLVIYIVAFVWVGKAMWKMTQNSGGDWPAKFNKAGVLQFAFPMFLYELVYLLMVRVDTLLVGHFLPLGEVGVFSAASKLAILVTFIVPVINYTIDPLISANTSDGVVGREKIEDLVQMASRWAVLYMAPVAAMLVLLGDVLLSLFGPDFSAGATVLIILVLCRGIGATIQISGRVLAFTGKPKFVLLNALVGLGCNVLLGLWLIPSRGIVGAAIASGVAFLIFNGMGLVQTVVSTKINPLNWRVLKPLSAATVVFLLGSVFMAAFEGIGYWALILLPVILVIYLLLVMAMGIEKDDLVIIKELWKKVQSTA